MMATVFDVYTRMNLYFLFLRVSMKIAMAMKIKTEKKKEQDRRNGYNQQMIDLKQWIYVNVNNIILHKIISKFPYEI